MSYKQSAYWCTLGKSNFWWLVKNLNSHLTAAKDLQRCQYFLKKFFACNQISSTGFCSGALGANKIQVINQRSGSQSLLTAAKNSLISSDLWYSLRHLPAGDGGQQREESPISVTGSRSIHSSITWVIVLSAIPSPKIKRGNKKPAQKAIRRVLGYLWCVTNGRFWRLAGFE